MERRMESNFEGGKEKGREVTIHAVFVRHGEKFSSPDTAETGLTPEGEQAALAFGESREKQTMAKSYVSRTDRTESTGKKIVEGSPSETKGKMRNRKELAFVCDSNGEFYKEVMRIKAEIMGPKEEFDRLTAAEKKSRLKEIEDKQSDYYLSFGQNRPDAKTFSPVETAANFASLADRYIRLSERVKSGSTLDLYNATHDFNLISFLSQVLVIEKDGQKKTGFNSVEEVGGSFEFTEAFEIIIHRDGEGKVSTRLLFRGKDYEIDEARFKELAVTAKNLQKINYEEPD